MIAVAWVTWVSTAIFTASADVFVIIAGLVIINISNGNGTVTLFSCVNYNVAVFGNTHKSASTEGFLFLLKKKQDVY